MSEKNTTCYFVGKDNKGNIVSLVDGILQKEISDMPRPRVGSSYLSQPFGSVFVKTIENPYDPGSENSTEPLTLAKGANLFFVGKDGNTLRPIINKMPQVYISNTKPEYLPEGSLFLKTTTNPKDNLSTSDLSLEGMYYVNPNGSLRKLLFTIGGES